MISKKNGSFIDYSPIFIVEKNNKVLQYNCCEGSICYLFKELDLFKMIFLFTFCPYNSCTLYNNGVLFKQQIVLICI